MEKMSVTCLLTFGEQAHLRTPHTRPGDAEVVPAEKIIRDTGVAFEDLPGLDLVAVVEEGELARFELP